MLAQYKYKIKWHLLVIIPSEFFCRWILLLLSNFKPLPTTVIEVVHSPQECFIHGWEEGQTNKMSGTWVRTHPLLFRTIWQPYRLSYIHAFRINLSYKPKDQSLKFWWKNTESGFENLSYFESAILIKKIASSPSKPGTNYGKEWMALNCYYYRLFPAQNNPPQTFLGECSRKPK